ncbi:MAG: 1-acyl-sn-glycerol-3-phosphate acyltransferase [Patescibacteria group bacterium]|nr:1-acyl-sn-glycerol-3-phosphate acyltransferase [Patescibacteria group bacterium]
MNKAASLFCKIFLIPIIGKAFIKETRGWENVPKENFILAANHQSHLDEIATGYICAPRRFRFIGMTDKYKGFTKLLLYVLYFLAGVIHLDRGSKDSKKKAAKEAIESLKDGNSLIIYPEGTRSRTGKVGQGKWGLANIFLETGVPILPVGIEGTFDLLPPGGKLKIKRIVKINIGKPLYFKEYINRAKFLKKNSKGYRQLLVEITQKAMQRIIFLKSELS